MAGSRRGLGVGAAGSAWRAAWRPTERVARRGQVGADLAAADDRWFGDGAIRAPRAACAGALAETMTADTKGALAALNEALGGGGADLDAKAAELERLAALWPALDRAPFDELHAAARLRGVVEGAVRLCHEGKIRPRLAGPDLGAKLERVTERLSAFGTFAKVRHDGHLYGLREVQMAHDATHRMPLVAAVVRGMFASHPNIVPTLAVRIDTSGLAYASPFAELGSLGGFLAKALLSPELQQKFIGEIIDGLVYLHACGWVHGNLKPSNVLVTLDADKVYSLQLADLGLAAPALTLGSVEYMAPELLVLTRGDGKDKAAEKDKLLLLWKSVTRASDVYAFGMLTWLITHHGKRKPPFKESLTAPDVAKAILGDKRPKTDGSVTDKGTLRLMAKCWDAKPNKRPDIRVMMQLFYEGTTRRALAGNTGRSSPAPAAAAAPSAAKAQAAAPAAKEESRGRSKTQFLAALLDELDEIAEKEEEERRKAEAAKGKAAPGFLAGPIKPEAEKQKREAEGLAAARERLARLLEATKAKGLAPEKVLLVLKQAAAKNEGDPHYSRVLEEEIERREQQP